jgi:hypothetical protein
MDCHQYLRFSLQCQGFHGSGSSSQFLALNICFCHHITSRFVVIWIAVSMILYYFGMHLIPLFYKIQQPTDYARTQSSTWYLVPATHFPTNGTMSTGNNEQKKSW